jgi:hypothetical protein
MKLFREHISLAYLTQVKSKSAFMTGEGAFTMSGESNLYTLGDALSVQNRAPPSYLS